MYSKSIDFEAIRFEGFENGHDAKRAGCYVPNPYLPGCVGYDHYQDGYDLGVMAARVDMLRECLREEIAFERLLEVDTIH